MLLIKISSVSWKFFLMFLNEYFGLPITSLSLIKSHLDGVDFLANRANIFHHRVYLRVFTTFSTLHRCKQSIFRYGFRAQETTRES